MASEHNAFGIKGKPLGQMDDSLWRQSRDIQPKITQA
jgi:hypothetical protein